MKTNGKALRVVHLVAENFKKLKVVEITPKGDLVTIAGKNAQGKSSVLDCLWAALAGAKHIQQQPIRKGQNKARIRLDMGELIVERKFTESGTSLTVTTADGTQYPSPQKILDSLIGELSFDPLAFSRMDAKGQFDELRRVSHLEVDIDKLDYLNQSDYQKRTELNRQGKAKRAQADAVTIADNLPETLVDESALLTSFQAAADENAKIEQRKANRENAARQVESIRADAKRDRDHAAELRAQADRVEELAKSKVKEADALQKKLDEAEPLPTPADLTELRTKLESAKQVNKQIAEREKYKVLVEEAKDLESQSETLTKQMDARESAKRDAIAAAKMPVEGLGFGSGYVTYKGIPFEQASDSEKLRVSLGIAMAANPKIRVIRISDGSLLDEDALAQVAQMAGENDYQVWLERVDGSGKCGIVLEDGMVVSTPETRDAAA